MLGQLRYLIKVIDYFTKWTETKALANITATKIVNFFKGNILAMFVVPHVVVIENGMQFIYIILRSLLGELKIKQNFVSIEHPQKNGQAKAASRGSN